MTLKMSTYEKNPKITIIKAFIKKMKIIIKKLDNLWQILSLLLKLYHKNLHLLTYICCSEDLEVFSA